MSDKGAYSRFDSCKSLVTLRQNSVCVNGCFNYYFNLDNHFKIL